jgi:serine phosphatase RsbU (regulator of sigma subunit)
MDNTLNKQKELFTVNKNRNNRLQNAAAAHRANLQKNLEHRLEVARANGDETLVRQLQQEASYLGLE